MGARKRVGGVSLRAVRDRDSGGRKEGREGMRRGNDRWVLHQKGVEEVF